MISVSGVIITFNEEKNIDRCLESLKGVVDEIIVVDSYSTDKTLEICARHGAKVVQHPFEGYREQKNYAVTQASHRYVLSLDADEALSEPLKKSIAKAREDWLADGYEMRRLTNYCGKWIKHCGWYPDIKLRLFDSEKGHWGGENPHDKYLLDDGTSKQLLDGEILHYSFYTIAQHMDTVNKFSTIKAERMHRAGKKVSLLNYFVNPCFRFFRDYFLKLGFRDGFYGFVICKNSAYSVFLKYVKLQALNKK